jgi:lipopolysaccharide exporter
MSGKPSPRDKGASSASITRQAARGVVWAVLMRWVMRLIGLCSTLILARVLSPADFGIVAMGMLMVHFLYELSEFGTSMHLIRAKTIDRDHCDTAWTITVLQGMVTAIALVALARPASTYFNEPRVVEVLYVLAAATMLAALENVGPVLMRRDMQFARDFRFNVFKKLLTFAATVGSALVMRNYWALVVGHVVGMTAGTILSYVVHPYRPRWSLVHAREYLKFGAAIIPLRLANVLREMVGSFMVAGIGNAAIVGSFRVASDMSRMFTKEIVTPMGRGLLPAYSRLAHAPDELSALYQKVLAMVALLCIPAGIATAAVAPDLALVLLGGQWGFAGELMQVLAIAASIYAVSQAMINQILVAAGRERSAAVLAWLRLGITAPILFAGMQMDGAMGLAKASIVSAVACLPVIYLEVRRAVRLTPRELFGMLWRPVLASAAMALAVRALPLASIDLALVRLMIQVAVAAGVLFVTLYVLWLLCGRPNSAERAALRILRTKLSAALAKVGRANRKH